MCRGITPVIGRRILDVRQPRLRVRPIQVSPRLATFRRRVLGRKVKRVLRIGKRVVLELGSRNGVDGDRIVIEPRMTGLVMLADPPDQEHLRLIISTDGGRWPELLFWDSRGLGVVRLISPCQFARTLGPAAIGPDALDITCELLQERLGPSRRPIKVALLDQRLLAGVGNLYASEILHRAGVHPALPCSRLRSDQWQRLHASMGDVLHMAIRHQGSTLRDGTYRIARDQPGGYQLHHRVYQRDGQACLACGIGRIQRIVQAQRSTFFCPHCQSQSP